MSKRILLPASLIALFALSGASYRENGPVVPSSRETKIDSIYMVFDSLGTSLPQKQVFSSAMRGFLSMSEKKQTTSNTISIIDFTLPSTEKRLWVIDLSSGRVLHHSLVAHGKNSGELYARTFSNNQDSYQSSLGFYLTGQTYIGKHGLSLKLHGLEPGINDRAEARAIVIHSANYVDDSYAKKIGRLGRSWGCPAIPVEQHKEIINALAGGTCLFIYYPDHDYLSRSRFIGSSPGY